MSLYDECEVPALSPEELKKYYDARDDSRAKAACAMRDGRNELRDFSGELVSEEGKRDALMRRFIIEEHTRILKTSRSNNLDVCFRGLIGAGVIGFFVGAVLILLDHALMLAK